MALAEGRYDMSPALLSLAAPTDLRKAAQFLSLTHCVERIIKGGEKVSEREREQMNRQQ